MFEGVKHPSLLRLSVNWVTKKLPENLKQFKVDDDSFWRRMKIPRSEFLALLPELIPETWSPSLTIAGDHVFALKRNIMYGNSSFGLAVQACLQKLD